MVLALAREAGDLVTGRLQTDGINCGVYVAKFLECLLTDLDIMSISTDTSASKEYCFAIHEKIEDKPLFPYSFCALCGDTNSTLVKCKKCTRHFHLVCHSNKLTAFKRKAPAKNAKTFLCLYCL